jgi:hypothetical protein
VEARNLLKTPGVRKTFFAEFFQEKMPRVDGGGAADI